MEREREGNVHPPPSALSTLIAIFSAVGEGRKEKNTFLRMASISISYWLVYILQGKPIFLTKLYCDSWRNNSTTFTTSFSFVVVGAYVSL